MGYWQDLYETYEYAKNWVGKPDKKDFILLPIAHSTQNAQIEVAVNLKGEFKSARKVEKAQAVTVIPVTEDSGSRSSGIAPHPLHDKLCYVAGDYAKYCDKKKAAEYYQTYIRQLKEWQQHGCHPAVEAVYRYLEKECLVQDLIGERVLETDESGKLRENVNIEGIAQTEAFVRFFIQDVDYHGVGEIWTDTEIYEDYRKYYLTQVGEADLDYITGAYITCAEKQPAKIRNSADKAKLISANDNDGFTYRGRFGDRREALSIGYVSSQQAHNALRWLIERQGYRKYGSCIVVWNPHDHEVPEWNEEPEDFFDEEEADVPTLEIAEKYAGKVRAALNGRYADIAKPGESVIIMGLDAATPGRLAVVYYNKVSGSQYLKNMTGWYTDCAWNLNYTKKRTAYPRTPIPEDIIRAAYGVEHNGNLAVDDKLMNDKLKQLLPCIVAGKDIPEDMYYAVIQNASRPLAYEAFNRTKIQEIACALICKKQKERERRGTGKVQRKVKEAVMALLREDTDRDYLYGRLMALYHKAEQDTFAENERGKRETNVERLMTMMVRNPAKTIVRLEEKLMPYWKKLNPSIRIVYEKEKQQIYNLFNKQEFEDNAKLKETYLLGYNTELSYLWDYWKNKGGKTDEYTEE